ncbi:hypothetical protein NSA52_09050 [Clostridium sporogenes]|nr:hypothetical protein [Clostridium sporogenes]MCR1974276.1 hypothetical protein [Clostridium sporogenes]
MGDIKFEIKETLGVVEKMKIDNSKLEGYLIMRLRMDMYFVKF